MTRKKISAAIKTAKEALRDFNFALNIYKKQRHGDPLRLVLFDACVKRFEVLFEYCWKLFKIAAEYQGMEASGPRSAIQEAHRQGWIKNIEFWARALDARNGSVHDYFGISDGEYLEVMQRFSRVLPDAIGKLEELKKS